MASNADSGQCAALTRRGTRCRYKAKAGSALCGIHQKGAVAASGSAAPITTIEEAIFQLGEKLGRIGAAVDEAEDLETAVRYFAEFAQGVSRFGRLLRDRQQLQGDTADLDELFALLDKATDEISAELGVEL